MPNEDSLLDVVLDSQELRIRPVQVVAAEWSSDWAREVYALFGSVRDQAAGYDEESVNAYIDQAVKAARVKSGQGRS